MKKLKTLINCNRVVFISGGWFTKFWMLSMPLFVLGGIFGDLNLGDGDFSSMWTDRENAWPMIVFFSFFLFFYPVRNYLEVNRILKGVKDNPELASDYKTILDIYNRVKAK